jgi:tetratricopeptide (TPR) repeat protein
VVVRFVTPPGANAFDALTASALSTRLTESLASILEASVRTENPLRDSLASAAGPEQLRVSPADDRWIITGDVSSAGDIVTVNWRVIDSRSGRHIRAGRTADNLISLPRLAATLLSAVGSPVGAESRAVARTASAMQRHATMSRQAMQAYLTGLYRLGSFGASAYKAAIEDFQSALRLDPGFVDGYLGLATAHLRIVAWGDSASARGRVQRLASAGEAVNRALALDPWSEQALSLLAQVHIARDEPVAASMAVDALRRIGARPAEVAWLTAEIRQVQGNATAASQALFDAGSRNWGHVPALFLRAELDRRQGRSQSACLALNRILVLDAAWAPAYVMRALVRADLGDRRGGWADAELAGRLGRVEWGTAVSALIDISMGEARTVRYRARQGLGVAADATLPWMDALLRAAVFHALGDPERARFALAALPCRDYRRRTLDGDPLLRFLRIPSDCRVSRQPASTE